MQATIKCYRVWMKDGWCGMYHAQDEDSARRQAIADAKAMLEGASIDGRDKRAAVKVKSVECLDRDYL